MHRFSNQEHHFLEPPISFLTPSLFLQFLFLTLVLGMGYSHLLDFEATLPNFRAVYNIPGKLDVAYCHESDIALQRCSHAVFFPLMAILEGGLDFPWTPLYLVPLGSTVYVLTNFRLIFTEE